ncbi:MAG: S-layer homology domain-containing protein, partial [Oscillospiraceae bacterium]|nr:S-layer homology domain-containing protein [Oscillospiraceae bacterium]
AMAIALTAGLPLTAGASGSKAVSMELANSHSDNTTQKGVNNILTAASPGDVITVTGSKTNAASTLTLNIPAGVKVLWKATYVDGSGFADNATLIDISGAGEFEVATGGSIISTKKGSAIQSSGANTLTVSGGTVEGGIYTIAMTGEGSTLNVSGGSVACSIDVGGYAVSADASSTINITGGEVSCALGVAIYAYSSTVNVSGGEVSCSGVSGSAIYVSGESTVNVSGGIVHSDEAENSVIYASTSTVKVSGGTVSCSGVASTAIYAIFETTVEVSGGEVSCSNVESSAIEAGADSTVEVSGGTVSCNKADSSAIFVHDSSIVNISNGTVGSSSYGCAVLAYGDSTIVNVSGGVVSSFSPAICIESSAKLNISDGTVRSYGHRAVDLNGAGTSVIISGGFVFGRITSIDGTDVDSVFFRADGAPAPAISAPGVVCGWKSPHIETYDEGSATELFVSAGATAWWAIHPVTGDFGVAYKHSAEDSGGFLKVEGVTVIPGESVAPTITGPTSMTLVEGYEACSTDAYAVGGTPEPVVTAQSDSPDITWNSSSKELDIAAGIEPGTYRVIIKAENGADPAATLTFTLTVKAEDDPDGGEPKPFPFTDVLPTDWFYDDVKTAWESGLINGITETLFKPENNLTYAEAVKLAACMHELYTTGAVTLTNGVPNWWDSFADYAKDNGIIDKDYEWGAPATRAGYMEIFANALPDEALAAINNIADGAIPDVPMAHPQSAAIYKLYRAGILQGVDVATHKCNPEANIKRSEVSAILTRMMNEGARLRFNMP